MKRFGIWAAGLATAALVAGAGAGVAAADDDSKTEQAKQLMVGSGSGLYRVAGEDRYATAVTVSQNAWDSSTAAVVFLATGENFPDALSIAASTGYSGPVLLTPRDALLANVKNEIDRLQPCQVVVVGGTAAVSDFVANEAAFLADPSRCE